MPRPKRRKPRQHKALMRMINNGHDTAELVRAADPDDGTPVHHAVNRTQTVWDRLHEERLIDRYQWQAACELHELWIQARPVPDMAAANMEYTGATGHTEPSINSEAFARLGQIAKALGRPCWATVERLVYDQTDPRTWGKNPRYNGMSITRGALHALAAEMGIAS